MECRQMCAVHTAHREVRRKVPAGHKVPAGRKAVRPALRKVLHEATANPAASLLHVANLAVNPAASLLRAASLAVNPAANPLRAANPAVSQTASLLHAASLAVNPAANPLRAANPAVSPTANHLLAASPAVSRTASLLHAASPAVNPAASLPRVLQALPAAATQVDRAARRITAVLPADKQLRNRCAPVALQMVQKLRRLRKLQTNKKPSLLRMKA